jgi:hypothetical protein
LDWWKGGTAQSFDRFTTVAGWWTNLYQEFDGQLYGPKAEEFRKVIGLPALVGETVEIALESSPNDPDRDLFTQHGWLISSPEIVTADPDAYRAYIMGSAGEFSCAKGLYVGTRGGWFSDRSECYLAAGRPVVIQDTGFSDTLPTGEGLLMFQTLDDAAAAIRAVRNDYTTHAGTARKIAATFFDSDRVLSTFLATIGVS